MQVHRILFEAANGYTNTLFLKVPVGINFFEKHLQIKDAAGDELLKDTCNFKGFSKFSLKAAGQLDCCPRNTTLFHEMSVVKN